MTALVSVIPILLLIVLMMGFKVSGYKSAIITLVVTILLALFAVPAMGIIPEKYAGVSVFGITLWSVVEGFLKACFPIILIIICAIFSYNILCETKEIETIKTQFIQMTSDKGLLVLLLTWEVCSKVWLASERLLRFLQPSSSDWASNRCSLL